jgi:hypothetical protein
LWCKSSCSLPSMILIYRLSFPIEMFLSVTVSTRIQMRQAAGQRSTKPLN